MFNKFMLNTMIDSQSEGQDFRDDLMAELDMIDQIEKELKILKQSRRELAIEEGFAQFKEVTIKEHIQKRFSWI